MLGPAVQREAKQSLQLHVVLSPFSDECLDVHVQDRRLEHERRALATGVASASSTR
jgi:hypothetical protein